MTFFKKTSLMALLLVSTVAYGSIEQDDVAPFKKAIITPEYVKEAITYEKEADKNSNVIPQEGESWFNVLPGESRIIISAPHATQPSREGQYRFSDGGGTAALAIMLGKLTDSTVIYTTKASPSDPNYYDNNAYKEKLAALIHSKQPKLIIDIHGSHPFRPYDVDIGTLNGKSLLGKDERVSELINILKNEGISNFSNNYFAASKNATVAKFGSNLGVPSIQLEINSIWMMPSDGNIEAHKFAQMLQGLVLYVNSEKKRFP
ncbi:N-formylglutamate amidohydrolase [Brenneria rubrifaciens]|uniref:Ketol-acid reductoisomerase n=1 Tax=Brenneria rubrifaciens TaxID=55213 RepID=A0A4P8QJA0_9GAMM|nr:N-formylglutamate amidohydrolase [Brenneria rubrifaciens]QCR07082.1 ketol-acid reductoisomerase [Brenneria rubrifaciens]